MKHLVPLAVFGAAALILTGCGVASPPVPTVTVTATVTPPVAVTQPFVIFPTLTGTPNAGDLCTVADGGAPKGYTAIANYRPVVGTVGKAIATVGGSVCGFTDAAGNQIIVGLSEPSADTVTALKAYYGEISTPTTAYTGSTPPDGVAYFAAGTGSSDGSGIGKTGDLGEANEFYTGFWIYVASKGFTSATDAKPLVNYLWEQFAPKA